MSSDENSTKVMGLKKAEVQKFNDHELPADFLFIEYIGSKSLALSYSRAGNPNMADHFESISDCCGEEILRRLRNSDEVQESSKEVNDDHVAG